jgi:hypothetical protein
MPLAERRANCAPVVVLERLRSNLRSAETRCDHHQIGDLQGTLILEPAGCVNRARSGLGHLQRAPVNAATGCLNQAVGLLSPGLFAFSPLPWSSGLLS